MAAQAPRARTRHPALVLVSGVAAPTYTLPLPIHVQCCYKLAGTGSTALVLAVGSAASEALLGPLDLTDDVARVCVRADQALAARCLRVKSLES